MHANAVLQGGKREREDIVDAPSASEPPAALQEPPSKRVRAPSPASPPDTHTDQTAVGVDQQLQGEQPQPVAAQQPIINQASQAAGPAAAEQHVARVAVTQHDPEHVQVQIELPSNLVQQDSAPQQLAAAPAAHTQTTEQDTGLDVSMTEPTASHIDAATTVNAENLEQAGEEGEVADATDSAVAPERPDVQDPQSTQEATGHADGSDADGAGGGARRHPIVWNPPANTPPSATQSEGEATPAATQRGLVCEAVHSAEALQLTEVCKVLPGAEEKAIQEAVID